MGKPKEWPVKCVCGSFMILVYREKAIRGPWFYGCIRFPVCRITHGCHQQDGKPFGTPADKETTSWRIRAHEVFDKTWKNGWMPRQGAYNWLSRLMKRKIHIGDADIETCKEIISLVFEYEDRLKKRAKGFKNGHKSQSKKS